jgi:xylulokinase
MATAPPLLLGVDLGTASVKALLLEEDGTVRGEGAAAYRVTAPHPGWAESDPRDWEEAAVTAVRQAVAGQGDAVSALGLCGQMHGVVLCDDGGTPARPAIIWADGRSRVQLDAYWGLDPSLRRVLRNPPATGMAGPSLLWLSKHEPEPYGRARWALQPKDWLRLRLTGSAAAEPSDASATLLYDFESDRWAGRVCAALGLRTTLLAPLQESASGAGQLSQPSAARLGLRPGIPLAAGSGDTAAAALGSGLVEPGAVQLTVGSGAQLVSTCAQLPSQPYATVHCFRAVLPGRWYLLAAMQNAGIALEWVRAMLSASWDEVYHEAFTVPPGAEGVTFVPYLTGERTPYFTPDAAGAYSGLRSSHGRAHLLRAALEGVAFAIRDGLIALEQIGVAAGELRLAGGGSLHPQWRQLLADILDRRLVVMPAAASARGAALLAGLASGLYHSNSDLPAARAHRGDPIQPAGAAAYEAAWQRFRHESTRHLGRATAELVSTHTDRARSK